jgi:hypothetical protein
METKNQNRPLTTQERELARWMLEHGSAEARGFLVQLDTAEVAPWRCQCGCASINFAVRGRELPPPGVHMLADFVFGGEQNLSGIFIYSSHGTLSGLEVHGLAGDAPKQLPRPEELVSNQADNDAVGAKRGEEK